MKNEQQTNFPQTDKPSPDETGYRGLRNVSFYAKIALPVGVLFAVVYFGMNWMTARRTVVYHLYFEWELAIPFVPSMIYAYASLLLLALLPAVVLTRGQMRALARAMVFTILVAALCYVLFPASLGFERPVHVPDYNTVYQMLFALERPYNLVPSLHIATTVLFMASILNSISSLWLRLGLMLWTALIVASVLLVHQHHMLDVITGWLLGWLTYRLCYLPSIKHYAD